MDQVRNLLQTALGERYQVERELGSGGMATVYLAKDLKHHRRVAIKVLRPELAQALGPKRFLREIKIAAQLNHPGILPVHDSGEGNGLLYYVMPYVEGESLRDRLNDGHRLTVDEVVRIVRGITDALAYAHSRGLVHRDIKPENVLFQAGHPMVSDFGIARAITEAGGTALTEVGLALGTPGYMSPEQALGAAEVDHRTDIYAIGVIAYELLTRQPPFAHESARRVIAAHIIETPRDITELRPDISPALAQLVMRCLEKDPSGRPQTAAQVLRILDSAAAGELVQAGQAAALADSRVMLRRALAAYAAAFAVIAAGTWILMHALGLPDWVFPGALLVMSAGLPAILLTAWVTRSAGGTTSDSSPILPGGHGEGGGFLSRLGAYATWRRTLFGVAVAMAVFAAGVGGFLGLASLGVGPGATLLSAGRLAPNEKMIVADFKVTGLTPGLGAALADAVRTALGESRAFSVIRASEMEDALARMKRPSDETLDLPLARELAVREGIAAVIYGEITPLGGGFLVGMRLIGSDSARTLAAVHTTVDTPRDLLAGVDRLTRQLRSKIGEPLKSVRASPPLERVTTSSLVALQKYSEGMRAIRALDHPKSVQLLQEAVAADSGFAMAWRALGAARGNAGFGTLASDSGAAMAFRHRDRLTELERYQVEAYYYWNMERDREKAARAYEALLDRYSTPGNLGLIYMDRREFARAEAVYRQTMEDWPHEPIGYLQLARALANQGKLAQAESTISVAVARFPPRAPMLDAAALLLFMKGERRAYARILDGLSRSADRSVRHVAAERLSALAVLEGRLADYDRHTSDARRLRTGRVRPQAFHTIASSLIDIEVRRQPSKAVERLDSAWRTERSEIGGWLGFHMARAYSYAGRPDKARAVHQEIVQGISDPTGRRSNQPFIDNVWALIALSEGRAREAIARYRKSDSLPDGPSHGCRICTFHDLGSGFEAAGERDSAIAMFESYVRTPDIERLDVAGWPHERAYGYRLPLVHERLARLYEARGDSSRAANHYAHFVDLWKDADAELQPRVTAARARIAALRRR